MGSRFDRSIILCTVLQLQWPSSPAWVLWVNSLVSCNLLGWICSVLSLVSSVLLFSGKTPGQQLTLRIWSLLWSWLSWFLSSAPFSTFAPESEPESYVTTDGQLPILSWNKAPIWGLQPDIYYCLTVAALLILGSLSDERTGLSFTIAAGPQQGSHFRVESRRLVAIFYCLRFETSLFVASNDFQGHGGGIRPRLHTGAHLCSKSQSQSYITTDGQSASLSWNKAYAQIIVTVRHLRCLHVGHSLWREDGSVVYSCCWPSPAQSFSGPSPVALVTKFYCLIFEISLFVASYDATSAPVSLMLRPTVSRPLCLWIKHPFGAYDQIFITVR
jgi:hypothetical protein